MEPREYQVLYEFEDTYWWYVARRSLVREMLAAASPPGKDKRVLDLGCGTGATAQVLKDFGQVHLLDMSPHALRFCKTRGLDKLIASSAEKIGLRENSIDAITSLDVMEHLDDDLAGMREAYRVLKPGGILLVTVPAFGFLWSEHDEALHHRRRYTIYELCNKLTVAGFDLMRSTYFITALFFPILVLRMLNGMFKKNAYPKTSHMILPPLINRMIEGVLAMERVVCRYINLPFGVSIVAVARKPY